MNGPLCAGVSALIGLAGAVPPTRAAQWTLEHSMESRLQADDNPDLSPHPVALAQTLSVTGAFVSALQTETRSTRVDAAAAAWWASQGSAQRRIDARLGLSQVWRDTTDEWRLGWQGRQETTYDNSTATAGDSATVPGVDLGLGRGQRRSVAASAGWSRALNEILNMQWQAQGSVTRYGREVQGAIDYRSAEASAGLSWRRSERDTLSLQLGHGSFATQPDASSTSKSLTLTLTAARALNEVSSASLSLGAYRSESTSSQNISICPLPVDFCNLGLVDPVVVQLQGTSNDSGLQYAATYAVQVREATGFRVTAERQQTPGGAGVVTRSDRLSASLEHSFNERAGLDASFVSVRSSYPSLAGSPQPHLQVLMASLSRRFSEGLSLRAGLQWTRSSEAVSRLSARSNQVYLTIKLDGLGLQATR
jgi:hypothetical protein